jgi:hypothetical protein
MTRTLLASRAGSASLCLAVALALAGCGGGDDYNYHGAIAINAITRAGGISANYQSQSEANNGALGQCGSGCSVVATFGNGSCGAVARGSDGAIGYSIGGSKAQAESGALSQCRSVGGIACEIRLSACNG